VLVVDDDAMILNTMAAVLAEAGFEVIAANSGAEALRCSAGGRIDILVSDVMMPAMNGCELARELLQLHPGVRVLLVTGARHRMMERTAHPVLDKPFTPDALIDAVRELLVHGAED